MEYLVSALRGTRLGERTFGVVTFSISQRDRIPDLLDAARTQHPEIEARSISRSCGSCSAVSTC